jgi:ribosomal protein L21E
MSLAQEMWDYLKSIGFEDISNKDDYRLGAHAGGWKNTIKYGDLCAYNDSMDNFIGFIDITKKFNQNNTDLNIQTVSDLEAWLRREYPEFFTAEQHQYKVGDKVRILEDVTYDNGDSVLKKYNHIKTAIGEIGVVCEVYGDTHIYVNKLPQKCGGGWTYKRHQIEPYIEECPNDTPTQNTSQGENIQADKIDTLSETPTNKQHQYTVGDKVRILENPRGYNGQLESVIGQYGLVVHIDIDSDMIVVGNLPAECGFGLCFKPHQIEPYIEEAPAQTTALGEAPRRITETDTPTDKRKEALIEEVISYFDWIKVHDVMTHLNWEWFMGDAFEVPTIGYMICSVQRSLSQVYDRVVINGSLCEDSSSGGFTTEAFLQEGEVHLKLCFNVAEWDTAL